MWQRRFLIIFMSQNRYVDLSVNKTQGFPILNVKQYSEEDFSTPYIVLIFDAETNINYTRTFRINKEKNCSLSVMSLIAA